MTESRWGLLNVTRFPIGSALGQYRFTISSSTITTCGPTAPSWSVKFRPLMSGTLSVVKNPGLTMRWSPHGAGVSGGGWYPSTAKLPVDQSSVNGMVDVIPTDLTPGTAFIVSMARSQYWICAVSDRYFALGIDRLNVSRLLESKP